MGRAGGEVCGVRMRALEGSCGVEVKGTDMGREALVLLCKGKMVINSCVLSGMIGMTMSPYDNPLLLVLKALLPCG